MRDSWIMTKLFKSTMEGFHPDGHTMEGFHPDGQKLETETTNTFNSS